MRKELFANYGQLLQVIFAFIALMLQLSRAGFKTAGTAVSSPIAQLQAGVSWPWIIAALFTAATGLIALCNIWERCRKKIQIIVPWDREHVDFKQFVYGETTRPSESIQVFILAGDKRWHPQTALEVFGSRWRVKCQFGNKDSAPESPYTVVAILGAKTVSGPVSELPTDGIQSQKVLVYRAGNPEPIA
jgi:hypothetical protein